jgi:hypothetical protein
MSEETQQLYAEIKRIYVGLPANPETNQETVLRRDFGAPQEPKHKPTLDSFCEVVSALGVIPEGDRLAYRIEHEDYTHRVRTRIIAPNENFVEIAIERPPDMGCYKAKITYKEQQRRTTALKIDIKGLKKKLIVKRLAEFSRTSPKQLKKVLGLTA